jgi:hypothetical protein
MWGSRVVDTKVDDDEIAGEILPLSTRKFKVLGPGLRNGFERRKKNVVEEILILGPKGETASVTVQFTLCRRHPGLFCLRELQQSDKVWLNRTYTKTMQWMDRGARLKLSGYILLRQD